MSLRFHSAVLGILNVSIPINREQVPVQQQASQFLDPSPLLCEVSLSRHYYINDNDMQ